MYTAQAKRETVIYILKKLKLGYYLKMRSPGNITLMSPDHSPQVTFSIIFYELMELNDLIGKSFSYPGFYVWTGKDITDEKQIILKPKK